MAPVATSPRTPATTSRRARVALILLGVALGLGLLEVGLRLAGAVWLWRRARHDAVATTAGDVVRVLCLGESTTALGGDAAYPRQLERTLNREGAGLRFAVVNAGVPGITSDAVLAGLDDLLDRHRPDVVVAMLGVNDTLVGRADVHGLPAFTALRVVKLAHFLVQAARARLGDATPANAPAHPIVAQAVGALTAGRRDEAVALLRGAAAAPDAPVDVVRTWAMVLNGMSRFDEARAILETWLAQHPDHTELRELVWQVELDRAKLAFEQRRLGDADAVLSALETELPDTARRARAESLAKRAAIAELRGRGADAARLRASAAALRTDAVPAFTVRNYRELVRRVRARGIRMVAVQYPLRPVAGLQALLGDPPDVDLVDNEAVFQEALGTAPWETWFTDAFAGDFGHMTPAGARLLAENVARAILATGHASRLNRGRRFSRNAMMPSRWSGVSIVARTARRSAAMPSASGFSPAPTTA